MTSKEWLSVMQQAEDFNHALTPLIIKYGELLLSESHPLPTSSDKELFQWVKASERNPDKNGEYIVKACEGDLVDHVCVKMMERSGNKWHYYSEGEDNLKVIEWLEKVSPVQPKEELRSAEEIKGGEMGFLKFLVEKIKYLKPKNHSQEVGISAVLSMITETDFFGNGKTLLQMEAEGGWVKCEPGCDMPDYDEPVLWLQENGNCVVDALDKDGNPHLYEPMYFDSGDKKTYLGNIVTHWRKLPTFPNE